MTLVLAGPTSAGKTEVALVVAERFDAVVLSADAMQVYRRLDIGTGKATAADQARVPHHGLDLVEPDEAFSAGDFVAVADEVLGGHPRVVVAGGTSMYLRALLLGLVETPPVDPDLRAELEGLADPHTALAEVDPVLASRLHPADRLRAVRGLEVFRQSGQRLSELHDAHAKAPPRVAHEAIWLDRPDLADRIDERVLGMVHDGYVDEVRAVLAAGFSRTLKPLQSLGYRHMCAHVLDDLPLDEAVRRTQRDTRRFARKQRTWMRGLGFPRVMDGAVDRTLALAEGLWGGLDSR